MSQQEQIAISCYLNWRPQVKYYGLASLDRYQRRLYTTGKSLVG